MSLEHERALIGAVLMAPECIDEHGLTPDLFAAPDLAAIFRAVEIVRRKGVKVDLISVSDALTESSHAGAVPTLAGIDSISAANAGYYADQLRKVRKRKGLRATANEMLASLDDPSSDEAAVMDEAERAFVALSSEPSASAGRPLSEVLAAGFKEIEADWKDRAAGKYRGIASGLVSLDRAIGSFREGELIVIGARPGSGKTVFSLGLAMHAATVLALPVVFLNLEMRETDLARRIMAAESGINQTKLREAFLKPSDFPPLLDASRRIANAPLTIYSGAQSCAALRSILRRERNVRGARLAVLDYFGLLTFPDDRRERWERFAEASKMLKTLALELGMILVINVQLNREAQGREPILADIRDTGSVEQDADLVIFLHPQGKPAEEADNGIRPFLAIVAKNRRGPAARVDLALDGPHCRFTGGR